MTAPAGLRIGVIGAGRLGSALAAALHRAGYTIAAMGSREPGSGGSLAAAVGAAATDGPGVLAIADVVFLTVPDGQVQPLAASLPWEARHQVVHCSGALGLDALAAAADAGATAGCLHPLQSFPSKQPEPERFRGIVCGVEGAGSLGALLERIVADLGARTIRLEGADRALYHAAAVFVSNDVVALMSAARRAWTLAGLPADAAREALAPLLTAVAANVSATDLREALTGPVARGDAGTVERHLSALAANPSLRELYRLLATELLSVIDETPGHRPLRDLLGER